MNYIKKSTGKKKADFCREVIDLINKTIEGNATVDEVIDFIKKRKKREKKENLEQTVEYLRKRYGRSAINRAVVLREKKFVELDIKDSHSVSSLSKNKG